MVSVAHVRGGTDLQVSFGLEEGVADLAELVGDEVDLVDVDADGGGEH